MRTLLKAMVLASAFPVAVEAETVGQARLAVAAWDCAAIGEVSGEYKEFSAPLFDVGYQIFSAIDAAMADGRLSDEDLRAFPTRVIWRLGDGPSTEFRLGVLWARFTDDARQLTWPDTNVRSTASGFADRWSEDREAQMIAANSEFLRQNCEFLVLQ